MRTLFLSAALLLTTATAFADGNKPSSPADATKMHNDDCARARKMNKTCVLDMKGEEVEGEKGSPGGTAIGIISFTKAESLIRIRRDFITEIIKSAEDID